ncbi:MAG: hypothetical protein EXS05_00680 [Planctomycetaceae bacterium]|nr:hypothetical protein [Planctomycetaceae bacterium]
MSPDTPQSYFRLAVWSLIGGCVLLLNWIAFAVFDYETRTSLQTFSVATGFSADFLGDAIMLPSILGGPAVLIAGAVALHRIRMEPRRRGQTLACLAIILGDIESIWSVSYAMAVVFLD